MKSVFQILQIIGLIWIGYWVYQWSATKITDPNGTSHNCSFSASVFSGFDVLVQAKEVLRVVLLLDGYESVVVGTERGFDRVFSLLTQEIQKVRTARERTH